MKYSKALAALFLCLGLSSCDKLSQLRGGQQPAAEAAKPAVDLVQQVKECSKIYTSEYQVSKIIVQRDEKRMKGKMAGINVNIGLLGGERIIAIPVEGVLKAYVDMADITRDNIREAGDSIEVILPDPKIIMTSSKINHKDIKEKVGIFQSKFTDRDLTRIQTQCRDSILADVPRLGLIKNARESASRTLISLFSALGYDTNKVTITFRQDDKALSAPQRVKEMLVEGVESLAK